MSELSIIIKAIECIYELIDCQDREPDKALIYKSMIKGCLTNLKEKEAKNEDQS